MTSYVFEEKGEEVISERHQKDFKKENFSTKENSNDKSFTDVSFDDF